MQIYPISDDSRARGGFTHKIVVMHSDLTMATNATAQTLTLFTLAPGQVVGQVATRLVTPFEDTGDAANNSTTVTLGDTGSAARYLAAQQINDNGTPVLYKAGTNVWNALTAADGLAAVFSAPPSGKNLAAFDAGELHVFATIVDLTALRAF